MGVEKAFVGIRVAEIGSRLATGACGSLMSQAGATVTFVEGDAVQMHAQSKHAYRAAFAAGKQAVCFNGQNDRSLQPLSALIAAADVVITSHDIDPDWDALLTKGWAKYKIVCDISAFGRSGPMAGKPFTDFQIQAMTGLIDTTGSSDSPPSPTSIPVTEYLAALHAFGGIGTALRAKRLQGVTQTVEVALYDCAFAAAASFLPKVVVENAIPKRLGNRHPMAVPWNVYQARDEWVLICTTSDDHWKRLLDVLGDESLANDADLKTVAGRSGQVDRIDAVINEWVAQRTVNECLEVLAAKSVPCAPIAVLKEAPSERNLEHRGMVCTAFDPVAQRDVKLPGVFLRGPHSREQAAVVIPPRFEAVANDLQSHDYTVPIPKGNATADNANDSVDAHAPLAGVRVIEIGSLTTGPLSTRMFGALGAEVIKIEPPSGDPMRHFTPTTGGMSHFFAYYNTDKKTLSLDLRAADDCAHLTSLLATADVLVQNLKEGALTKLGFSQEVLEEINPKLVRCDISGFGQDTIYHGRPALDSIIQAMSGIMTLSAAGGIPMKSGITCVDLQGALLAFGGVIAALEDVAGTGKGAHVDIAMQDVAAWATQTFWNGWTTPKPSAVIACADGPVIALAAPDDCRKLLTNAETGDRMDAHLASADARADVLDILAAGDIDAAPLCTIADLLQHPQTVARDLHYDITDPIGGVWPAMRLPLVLSKTPAHVGTVIGPVDHDRAALLGTDNAPA